MKAKSKYKCDECGKTFNHVSNLREHSKIHSKIKPYECDLCDRTFARSQELKLHKNYHLGIKPFHCKTCDKRFSQPTHLKAHIRTHTGEKPHKCPLCPKRFTQSSHLRTHQTHHTGEKPYKCEICGTAFRLPSTLKCHMRRHTGEKPYKCHICGMRFSQTTPLYHHLSKHSDGYPFKCRRCGKGFRLRQCCKDHEATVCSSAGGRRRFQCVFCKDRHYTQEQLERHIRLHIQETPYFCKFCDLCFISDEARRYHMRIHVDLGEPVKDKPFKCSQCHHSFELEDRYLRHIAQNHRSGPEEKKQSPKQLEEVKVEVDSEEEDPGGRYYCQYCNASFEYHEDMKDHYKVVHLIRNRMDYQFNFVQKLRKKEKKRDSSRKRFKCDQCEFRFEDKMTLALHRRLVHEGVEPQQCAHCWISFPTQFKLNCHLKSSHKGKDGGNGGVVKVDAIKTKVKMEVPEQISMEGMTEDDDYAVASVLEGIMQLVEKSVEGEMEENGQSHFSGYRCDPKYNRFILS